MMPGTWDANIKLLTAVDDGADFAVDTIDKNTSFDVLANLEIGSRLNEVVTQHDLFVQVQNLSQSNILAAQNFSQTLTPQVNTTRNLEQRLDFNVPAGGWPANEGDILEAVASYKVTAGVNSDYSASRSQLFIVSVGP
jgi:hypothetical protein